VIASIGTAGVGGGATNVSIVVLSMLALPLDLVGVLISIDFIVDMGRTLINVNDSIVAGVFVGRMQKNIDEEILAGRKVIGEEVHPLLSERSVSTEPQNHYTEANPDGFCSINL
jgi:Na+/H+-dicarboxylate symporter